MVNDEVRRGKVHGSEGFYLFRIMTKFYHVGRHRGSKEESK